MKVKIHTPIVTALYEVDGLQPRGTNVGTCLIFSMMISYILDPQEEK